MKHVSPTLLLTALLVTSAVNNSEIDLAHEALDLWGSGYSAKYRFPMWAADEWHGKLLSEFGPSATIYHSSPDLPLVRTMAVFREPTNIAMDRHGTRKKLDEFYFKKLFDHGGKFMELFPEGKFSNDETRNEVIRDYYDAMSALSCHSNCTFRKNLQGAYSFTNKDYKMPTISAYARTPMRYKKGSTVYRNEKGVHVLSLVGAAFDSHQQPDYQYFFDAITRDIREDREEEFFEERQMSIITALQCAFDKGLDRIEFIAVGSGAFSMFLPKNRVMRTLQKAWNSKEVQNLKKAFEEKTGHDMKFIFRTEPPYSHENGLGGKIPSFYKESNWTGNGFFDSWEDAIERTLFINAWDSFSLVGNGNEMDHSVDGMYGRQSALALLCWPVTNPHLTYRQIDTNLTFLQDKEL